MPEAHGVGAGRIYRFEHIVELLGMVHGDVGQAVAVEANHRVRLAVEISLSPRAAAKPGRTGSPEPTVGKLGLKAVCVAQATLATRLSNEANHA